MKRTKVTRSSAIGPASSAPGLATRNARPQAAAPAHRRRLTPDAPLATASWTEFVEQYETFTGLLCSAAQYGCSDSSEREYESLRTWFMLNYYHHAPRLRSYLGAEAQSRNPSLPAGFEFAAADASHSANTMDGFESIFLPRTLRELFSHDDGNLISLVSHISHAIYESE